MAEQFHDAASFGAELAAAVDEQRPDDSTDTNLDGEDVDPEADDPPAVVVVGGDEAALAVARALGSEAVPTAVAATDADGVAWRSDSVVAAGELPDPAADPATFRAALADLTDDVGEFVAVPCSEAATLALLDDVPDGVVTMYPDPDVALATLDTELVYGFADDLDVDRPEAYHVAGTGDDEGPLPTVPAEDAADALGYPLECVAAAGEWLAEAVGEDPLVADDADDLAEAVAAAEAADRPLLLRERVDVERDLAVASRFGEDATHTSVEVEVEARRGGRHGPACLVDLLHGAQGDAVAAEEGLRLLNTMGYRGLCSVRLVRTPDDRTVLLDATPYPPRWLGLVTDSGPNLPYAAYVDAIDADEFLPAPPVECRWVAAADYLRYLANGGEDYLTDDQWNAYVTGRFHYAVNLSAAVLHDSDVDTVEALVRQEVGLAVRGGD